MESTRPSGQQGGGVTISPRQADIARRQARLRGLARQLSFLDADFTTVVGLPPFHCAFAIEPFVHFSAPDVFFVAAARSLEPGGRLVVVDDFLSREHFSPREGSLALAFQKGWILSSLCTVGRAGRLPEGPPGRVSLPRLRESGWLR